MWESLFGEVEKWYRYRLQEIFAIEENKNFWDVSIQCGHVIVDRKAYIINKKVDAKTIAVAFQGDTRMRNKEMEKIKKNIKIYRMKLRDNGIWEKYMLYLQLAVHVFFYKHDVYKYMQA